MSGSALGGGRVLAVTVIGRDRPGIVADVSKALFEARCNLQDVSSTILRGHFSMVLIVDCPPEESDGIAARLRDVVAGVDVHVDEVERVPAQVEQPTHVVSVYGGDRPGIVFRIAERLAAAGVNITDLTSRVIGPDDDPVYALMLEVAGDEDLEPSLKQVGVDLEVEVTVRPIEADLL